MKKENPVQYILKITTVSIIEELYCSGKYLTYRAAASDYYTSITKTGMQTGFKHSSFDKFYQNYRKFKSKYKKELT